MYMVNDHYALKHSRYSIVFQLCLLILISALLYQMYFIAWVIATTFLILIWKLFRRQNTVEYVQQLDQDLWSVKYQHQPKIFRAKIRQILNHGLYVIIYFEHSELRSIIIWKDQVEILAWKRLLTRANLS